MHNYGTNRCYMYIYTPCSYCTEQNSNCSDFVCFISMTVVDPECCILYYVLVNILQKTEIVFLV